MRIVRFSEGKKVKYGVLEGKVVHGLRGSPFTQFKGPGSSFRRDGSTYKLNEVKLLAPCTPSKVIGLGLNHKGSGANDRSASIPKVPLMFSKPSTGVIGPDDNIVLPKQNTPVHYEGELGVIIGKTARNVAAKDAKNYVIGYTCTNDIGAPALMREDNISLTRGKGFDTFQPIGPWIETDVKPDNLKLETHINGELCQSDRTSGLAVGIPELIEFISGVMTLLPGDVISSGSPPRIGGTQFLKAGDVIEVTIERIGTLRNVVAIQA